MVVMEIGTERLIMHIICYLTHTFEWPPTQYGQLMHSTQHMFLVVWLFAPKMHNSFQNTYQGDNSNKN